MKSKSQIYVKTQASVQSSLRKLIFGSNCQSVTHEQISEFSGLAWICYFWQNILPLIVVTKKYEMQANGEK